MKALQPPNATMRNRGMRACYLGVTELFDSEHHAQRGREARSVNNRAKNRKSVPHFNAMGNDSWTSTATRGVVRAATRLDAGAIAGIYNHYIEHSISTFELLPVTRRAMAARIDAVVGHPLPWLVLEQDQRVVGYAYAAPWKERPAYRRSVESTVYVDHRCTGRRVGQQLYQVLLADLRTRGAHAVLGGIALPNPASIALHERFGFTKVAHLAQVGWKHDRWVDVGYWQLLL